MGIFDSNIHMNGAGTTYQSFLDLADEAEQKGGARKAFLNAIAKEFGYTARSIAEKTLSEGGQAVPLTARTIRAVNQAASMSANHWSSARSCIMQLRQGA